MLEPGLHSDPPSDPEADVEKRGVRPIRKYLAALSAVLITAALLAGSAPVEAKLRKVALGTSMHGANWDIATLQSFTADVGGIAPAIWTLWSTWGAATKEFPTEMANKVRAGGSTVMFFWEPAKSRESCEFARHKDIANGRYDAYIRRWAQAAKAHGHTVLLRFAHEINGSYFPWSVSNCGNTLKAYKKGWRHIHDIFRQVGARNVKFVWTVARQTWQSCGSKGCNPYARYYPGDKYVDYVGFSSFNWGAPRPWKSMLQLVSGVMKYFTKFTSKPVIVAENASNKDGGDKPAWIRDGYAAVYNRYPQVKAIVYLNVDLSKVGHPDWSLNTPKPGAINAYKDVASQARFQGKFN